MIRVRCVSNLDLRDKIFPEWMPAVPRVGDYIQSKTETSGVHPTFQVISIIWRYDDNVWMGNAPGNRGDWIAEIRLGG